MGICHFEPKIKIVENVENVFENFPTCPTSSYTLRKVIFLVSLPNCNILSSFFYPKVKWRFLEKN